MTSSSTLVQHVLCRAPETYEQTHVHQVYAAIAPHFSQTRHKPWPVVDKFLRAQRPGSVGLDVGCGNGKYLGVNPNVVMVGSDRYAYFLYVNFECGGSGDGACLRNGSEALVKIAAQHYHSTQRNTQHSRLAYEDAVDDRREAGGEATTETLEDPGTSGREADLQQEARESQSKSSEQRAHGSRNRNGDDSRTDVNESRRRVDSNTRNADIDTKTPITQTHSVTTTLQSTATLIIADTLSLPHPPRSFDFAICIAVIHHLSTRQRRVEAIREILDKLRVCKARFGEQVTQKVWKSDPRNIGWVGQALLFVWALEQKGSRRGWDVGDEQDQLVPWVMKSNGDDGRSREGKKGKQSKVKSKMKKEITNEVDEAVKADSKNELSRYQDEVGREIPQQDQARSSAAATGTDANTFNDEVSSELNPPQSLEPSQMSIETLNVKVQAQTYHRFYHLYQHLELESECLSAGAKVVESGFDRDNWWVIVEPLLPS